MSAAVIYGLRGIADSEGNFGGVRFIMRSRDSSEGIETRYGLDGPGICLACVLLSSYVYCCHLMCICCTMCVLLFLL